MPHGNPLSRRESPIRVQAHLMRTAFFCRLHHHVDVSFRIRPVGFLCQPFIGLYPVFRCHDGNGIFRIVRCICGQGIRKRTGECGNGSRQQDMQAQEFWHGQNGDKYVRKTDLETVLKFVKTVSENMRCLPLPKQDFVYHCIKIKCNVRHVCLKICLCVCFPELSLN